METYIVKLKPKGAISKIPEANTIFGAICWGIKEFLGEDLKEYLEQFEKKPDFIVSNCYEVINNNENDIYLLPRPMAKLLNKEEIEYLIKDEENFDAMFIETKIGLENKELSNYFKINKEHIAENRKKLEIIKKQKEMKKIKMMSEGMFFYKLNAGSEKEIFEEWLYSESPKGIISDIKIASGIKKYVSQKNVIDRVSMSVSEDGGTFYEDEIYLKDSNLYFLIQTDNMKKLRPVIKYIAEKGFGANKSTGRGQFEAEIIEDSKNKFLKEIRDNLAKNSNLKVNIGKYIPSKNEVEYEESMYELEVFRSKIEDRDEFRGANLDKPRITQIKEGSVIKVKENNKKYYGGIYNIKKESEQNIYHYAVPFFLNMMEVE